jgi:hypothetical protein
MPRKKQVAAVGPEAGAPLPPAGEVVITLDPANANVGTPRGAALLSESLDRCGAGRSILADKHGVVIAGNKTYAAAKARGLPVEVVSTNGQELVVVQRTDLRLAKDRRARQLAYYDNRVAEVDLSWSPAQIRADLSAGIDLSSAFFPYELAEFDDQNLAQVASADAPAEVIDLSVAVPSAPVDAEEVEVDDLPRAFGSIKLSFHGIAQRQRWAGFIRILGERYPEAPTPSARLMLYLDEIGFS